MKIDVQKLKKLLNEKKISLEILSKQINFKSREGFMHSINRNTIPIIKYLHLCQLLEIPWDFLISLEDELDINSINVLNDVKGDYNITVQNSTHTKNIVESSNQIKHLCQQLKSLQAEKESLQEVIKAKNELISILKQKSKE